MFSSFFFFKLLAKHLCICAYQFVESEVLYLKQENLLIQNCAKWSSYSLMCKGQTLSEAENNKMSK